MIVLVGEWAERGACRAAIAAGTATQDDWYPERWGDSSKALRICNGCPVRQECLDHTITHNEQHGIWGGVGPKHPTSGTSPGARTPNAAASKDTPDPGSGCSSPSAAAPSRHLGPFANAAPSPLHAWSSRS